MTVEREVSDALIVALAAGGLLVGDGEQPDGAGWTATPGQSTFAPYAVVHPISGGISTGTIGVPHGGYELVYQVSCFGATRAQCQWVADTIHPVALAARPTLTGHAVMYVHPDMLGGARRDDVTEPPIWQAVPRYRFTVSS